MTPSEIALLRLVNQRIVASNLKTPLEIVSWMGAMQAQDFSMCKWGIGLRLADSTNQLVENAIAEGEIIRTHVLRPTWHVAPAKDISWMIALTAPHIRSSMKSRNKELELTEKVLAKSNKVIEKAVAGGNHLTREELMIRLEKAKLLTVEQRGVHMLLAAELDKIICSGPTKKKKITYALFAERVPAEKAFTREEALTSLANRYFNSHGPATLQDFIWWSGLPVADARKALENVKEKFVSETIEAKTYWFPASLVFSKVVVPVVQLLPAFDEFMISYKDRTACLAFEHNRKTISINGIFFPIIVINGQVVGLWKRILKKNKIHVQLNFFRGLKRQHAEFKQLFNEASLKVSEFFSS